MLGKFVENIFDRHTRMLDKCRQILAFYHIIIIIIWIFILILLFYKTIDTESTKISDVVKSFYSIGTYEYIRISCQGQLF